MLDFFVLFTGGTGGHVLPSVSFGNYLIDNGYKCILITDVRGKKYTNQLKSNFADMGNISGGSGGAGTVTAACFLEKFVNNIEWAHLDIAGVAWLEGSKKGATGRPVALISEFLIQEANKS